MTTVDASHLRETTNRMSRRVKTLEKQNERLVRMLMLERVKSLDVDMSQSLDLTDNYRPLFDPDDGEGYAMRFSPQACASWLDARRGSL